LLTESGPDFPTEGFQKWMDDLIGGGDVEPMIIVMPDAKTKYGFCFYTNSVLQGNYEDFIANDLVNFMDDNYQTIPNRNGRIVIGHSQGGYGAIRMGLFRSDVFSIVAAHVSIPYFEGLLAGLPFLIAENPTGMNGPSPDKGLTTVTYGMAAAWTPNLNNPPFYVDLNFVYPSGQIRTDVWQRQLQHDPYTLLDTRADYLKSLKGFYIDGGLQDPWGELVTVFHHKLVEKEVPHYYEMFNGGHFDKMFERLKVSLKYCSERYRAN
jgi:enterochelin esterase-like enzyme